MTAEPGSFQKFSVLLGRLGLAAAAALAVIFAPLPGPAAAPVERVFHVQAERFAYAPAVLQVNPGDRVIIELEALDVVHGLEVDGYAVEATAEPGQIARISFTADQSGAFRFRCTVSCGNMHPFMIGKLQVGTNDLFLRAVGLALVALAAGLVSIWK